MQSLMESWGVGQEISPARAGFQNLAGKPAPREVRLTPRERECLTWAARGKTAWETAVILSNSESAVKKHLAAASEKLDARTRTQAVALALVRGFIQL